MSFLTFSSISCWVFFMLSMRIMNFSLFGVVEYVALALAASNLFVIVPVKISYRAIKLTIKNTLPSAMGESIIPVVGTGDVVVVGVGVFVGVGVWVGVGVSVTEGVGVGVFVVDGVGVIVPVGVGVGVGVVLDSQVPGLQL